jgi:hypothetical protein
MPEVDMVEIVEIVGNSIRLSQICECPLCHTVTQFYRTVGGSTYCYRCAPEEANG